MTYRQHWLKYYHPLYIKKYLLKEMNYERNNNFR